MLKKGFRVLSVLAAMAGTAAAGNLYVSDASFFTVAVFDSTTGAFTGNLTPVGGWGIPAGIAVAPNGNVFVADNLNNVVDQFSPAGLFLSTFIASGLFEPTGLAFGPDGNLYVANFGVGNNSYISRFDSTGNPVDATPFVPSSTGLFDPEAIAFGPDGNLYIADSSNDAIDQVLPGGSFTTLVSAGCPGTPFTNPQGVAFGPTGGLFVSDAGSGCGASGSGVYQYNTSGTLLGTFIAPPNTLSTPTDLVFGPDGNLYITDASARVALFNGTTGTEMADFVPNNGSLGPLIDPTFLAFSNSSSPAPEPTTLAMGALALVGLATFRRWGRPSLFVACPSSKAGDTK